MAASHNKSVSSASHSSLAELFENVKNLISTPTSPYEPLLPAEIVLPDNKDAKETISREALIQQADSHFSELIEWASKNLVVPNC
jgi:hypothetical protein